MSFRIQQTTVPAIAVPAAPSPAAAAPVPSPVLVHTQGQAQPSTAQLQDQIKQLQSQLQELKSSSALKVPSNDSAILLSYHSPCPSPRR